MVAERSRGGPQCGLQFEPGVSAPGEGVAPSQGDHVASAQSWCRFPAEQPAGVMARNQKPTSPENAALEDSKPANGFRGILKQGMKQGSRTLQEGLEALSSRVGAVGSGLLRLPEDELIKVKEANETISRLLPTLTLAIQANSLRGSKRGADTPISDEPAAQRPRTAIESGSSNAVSRSESSSTQQPGTEERRPLLHLDLVSDAPFAENRDQGTLTTLDLKPGVAQSTTSLESNDTSLGDDSGNVRLVLGRADLQKRVTLQFPAAAKRKPTSVLQFVSREFLLLEVPDTSNIAPTQGSMEMATLVWGCWNDSQQDADEKPPLAYVSGLKSGYHLRKIRETRWTWIAKGDKASIEEGDTIAIVLESPPGSEAPAPSKDLNAEEARCILGCELRRPLSRGHLAPAFESYRSSRRLSEAMPTRRELYGLGAASLMALSAPTVLERAFVAPGTASSRQRPSFRATAQGRVASAGQSSSSASSHAALAIGLSAALGAGAARAARPARSPKVHRAQGGEWQPRLSGWTAAELAGERQRAQAMPDPPGYNGPRYTGPGSITDGFIDALLAMQKDGQLLPKKDAYLILLDIIDILRSEKTLGQASIPAGGQLTVVGDLHGQYWDFLNLLSMTGKPSANTPFVFNGDFVDRGSWSIEVILSIFALKLKDPQSVFLNRGNHEMLETNILYGFCGECGSKYDMDLFNLFSEAFRNLPLAHLVDGKVLILHGGLPGPDPRIWMPGQTHDPTDAIPMTVLPTLQDIGSVDRYLEITPESYGQSIGPTTTDKEVNDMRKLIDILWGDPRGGDGYGPSYRKGKGVYMFGPSLTAGSRRRGKPHKSIYIPSHSYACTCMHAHMHAGLVLCVYTCTHCMYMCIHIIQARRACVHTITYRCTRVHPVHDVCMCMPMYVHALDTCIQT
ncbi:PAPP5 [Symbiodinium sp. CCMP2592]|nr:PAPP5 [Symbiodinium sp. CCMP2592]